jgi:hypothetical protein
MSVFRHALVYVVVNYPTSLDRVMPVVSTVNM